MIKMSTNINTIHKLHVDSVINFDFQIKKKIKNLNFTTSIHFSTFYNRVCVYLIYILFISV